MEIAGIVQALIQGLAFGGIFALISSGMTLTHNVTGQINVAHGTFMIVAIYIMFVMFGAWGLDPYISVFITMPIMFLLGLAVFYLTFKKVIYYEHVMVFQFFIAWILIVEYGLLVLFSGTFRSVTSFITLSKIEFGTLVLRTAQLVAFLVALVVIAIFYWLLMKTEFGRTVRATAQIPEVARLMGVNVGRLQVVIFGISFVLVALAAGLLLPYFTFNPYSGLMITLFALIIMVMGGFGSWEGTLLSSLIIGVVYGMSYYFIPTAMAALVPYLLFAVILVFRPLGIFGEK